MESKFFFHCGSDSDRFEIKIFDIGSHRTYLSAQFRRNRPLVEHQQFAFPVPVDEDSFDVSSNSNGNSHRTSDISNRANSLRLNILLVRVKEYSLHRRSLNCQHCVYIKETSGSMWECSVCTLLNEEHRTSCEVCETPRPPPVLRLGADPPTGDGTTTTPAPAVAASAKTSSKAATLALRTPPSERHERANARGPQEAEGGNTFAAASKANGCTSGAASSSTGGTATSGITATAAAASSTSTTSNANYPPAVSSRAGLSVEERQKRQAEIAAKRIRKEEQQRLERQRFEEDRSSYNELHSKQGAGCGSGISGRTVSGAAAQAMNGVGGTTRASASAAARTAPERCTSVRLQVKSEMRGTTVNTTAFGPDSMLKDVRALCF